MTDLYLLNLLGFCFFWICFYRRWLIFSEIFFTWLEFVFWSAAGGLLSYDHVVIYLFCFFGIFFFSVCCLCLFHTFLIFSYFWHPVRVFLLSACTFQLSHALSCESEIPSMLIWKNCLFGSSNCTIFPIALVCC